jgi:hypothetical protein
MTPSSVPAPGSTASPTYLINKQHVFEDDRLTENVIFGHHASFLYMQNRLREGRPTPGLF